MPSNTVVVARPSKWGNPYRIERSDTGDPNDDEGPLIIDGNGRLLNYVGDWATDRTTWKNVRERVVSLFRADAVHMNLAELRGKNLACWCPLDQPCHADVLLELANAEQRTIDA